MNIILIVKHRTEDFFTDMGHSRANKEQSHARIVQTASARFREAGVEGVGVADLMKDAGLTHGGFYRHFASRDELVAEAVECALSDGGRAVEAVAASKASRQTVAGALVDAYLSTAHRDGLATSCAVTTLAGDVARSNERARTAYTRQVETYLDLLANLAAEEKSKAKRAKAIAALSSLVGAVSLSRAVNDEKLSREILKAAADELKALLG
ncbi:TetR/AcrR family transcriptional regulator [Variovorax sp. E3]|uniref:TetR/AcrR family transcriptional regulator n=1 Tax=Variovorax sp. E3 TaxID=1914993 RepID=UPI0022B5F6A7|nr:TetR/AcrR family transcriptional regulator [Variovorax sp. E3]